MATHSLATKVVMYVLNAGSVTNRLGMDHAGLAQQNAPLRD